jgi:phage gpG-like protein
MIGFRHTGGPDLATIARTILRRHGPGVDVRAAKAAGAEVAAIERQAFNAESTPEGRAWAPLKQPRSGRILRRSGALRRGATVAIVWGNTVRLRVPSYGAFHLTGTSRMPARPWQPMTPFDPVISLRIETAMRRVVER